MIKVSVTFDYSIKVGITILFSLKHITTILALVLIFVSTPGRSQKLDTIKLSYNQMLICSDTIYFGVSDSVVYIPQGDNYKIQRNILLPQNEMYTNNEKKRTRIEQRISRSAELWDKAYNYSVKDTTKENTSKIKSSEAYFKQFEGKIIRSISYKGVDMFEGQVLDTTKISTKALTKSMNAIHIPTHNYVIRQNLRFEEGDELNARYLSENERLLRRLSYIQDARIIVNQNDHLSDSVDLQIITQDRLPLGVRVRVSDYNEFSIVPYFNNYLGTGDNIEAGIHYAGDDDEPWGYTIKYESQNIAGTFIDADIYRVKKSDKDNYGVSIARPFSTIEMKHGGEFKYDNVQQKKSYLHQTIDTTITAPYHSSSIDTWYAQSHLLAKVSDVPSLSVGIRYLDLAYLDSPEFTADSNIIFHDQNLLLTNYMVQKIRYVQTQKLSGFGITEDIPIGYSAKVTTGFMWNEFSDRPYLGLDFNTILALKNNGILSFSAYSGSFFRFI